MNAAFTPLQAISTATRSVFANAETACVRLSAERAEVEYRQQMPAPTPGEPYRRIRELRRQRAYRKARNRFDRAAEALRSAYSPMVGTERMDKKETNFHAFLETPGGQLVNGWLRDRVRFPTNLPAPVSREARRQARAKETGK